jgi:O-antigen/teichoic acid export membrane protein
VKEMNRARHSVKQRLAIGTLSNYAAKLLAAAIALLLTPFVLHHLGPARFSLWALVASIASYGSLLDFGIGAAVVKYVAEHRARQEWPDARTVLATALWLYLGLALLGILLSVGVAYVITPRLPLSPDDAEEAWWLALLLGSAAALSLPCSIPAAALKGANRFDIANLLASLGGLVGAGLTVALLLAGGGVRALAAGNIAVMLVMQAPSLWMLWRIEPELRFSWTEGRCGAMRRIFAFSAPVFAVGFADLFHSRAGEVVIGAFLPVRAIAPYALAKRLTEVAQALAGQFARVLPPVAAELNATGDRQSLCAIWMASTRLTIAIFVPIGCTLGILAAPLLRAWAGAEFVTGAPIVMLLVPAYLFEISTWPAAAVIQAMNRYAAVAVASICSGLCILALAIIFVPRIGISGAALAILIPTSIESLGFVLPFTLRLLGIGFGPFVRTVVAPIVLPALAMCSVLAAVRHWLHPQSMLLLALSAVVAGTVYGALYLLSSHTAIERRGVLQLARALRAAAAGS